MTRAEAINKLKNDGPLDEDIIIMWWDRNSAGKDDWPETMSELSIQLILRLLKKSGLIREDHEKNRTSKVYDGIVKVKQRISKETKYITKNRYIWLQSMTDEQPPLFFLAKNILEEKPANLEHSELLKERAESKRKHFESLEAIKHKLHEREVEKAIENDEPPPPKPKRVEYISLRQYLFDTKLEHGVRYIYNDTGGNPIIYDHK